MSSTKLVEYAKRRAGNYLRGVVRYDESSKDILYLRDDVRERRLESQIDRMLARLEPEATSAEERAFPFGDLHATVRRFDEAIIMHFPRGRRGGVVVSFEQEATRDLNSFTTECLKRIHE
jgi:hypothetical protein